MSNKPKGPMADADAARLESHSDGNVSPRDPVQQFQIGQVYVTRGANPRRCTIVDVWKTYNAAGELVRLRYVSTHDFMGQVLRDVDVVGVTVALGLVE